jgi:hypothetical protein
MEKEPKHLCLSCGRQWDPHTICVHSPWFPMANSIWTCPFCLGHDVIIGPAAEKGFGGLSGWKTKEACQRLA